MLDVHSSAIVGPDVEFGRRVKVGPYSIIEDNVIVGNDTVIAGHVILRSGIMIGENCKIDSFSVIGGVPQDTSFDKSIISGVIIGNNTVIRECVTIHRSTSSDQSTKIGNSCMLQSGSHVAHDCVVGDGTILGTGSMLGGKVAIGTKCFIGGGSAIHQRAVVGDYVILSGNCATSLDVPPYCIAAEVSTIIGLNLVGLRRANIETCDIIALKECFREFYKRSGNFGTRAKSLIEEGYSTTDLNRNFLNFFLRESKLGFATKRRKI